jgi:hypothetical protein
VRAELRAQAEAHQRELTGLKDRLQDTHLAQHAAAIAKLQAQLQEALNAAGHGQQQRIWELEQQVRSWAGGSVQCFAVTGPVRTASGRDLLQGLLLWE